MLTTQSGHGTGRESDAAILAAAMRQGGGVETGGCVHLPRQRKLFCLPSLSELFSGSQVDCMRGSGLTAAIPAEGWQDPMAEACGSRIEKRKSKSRPSLGLQPHANVNRYKQYNRHRLLIGHLVQPTPLHLPHSTLSYEIFRAIKMYERFVIHQPIQCCLQIRHHLGFGPCLALLTSSGEGSDVSSDTD